MNPRLRCTDPAFKYQDSSTHTTSEAFAIRQQQRRAERDRQMKREQEEKAAQRSSRNVGGAVPFIQMPAK